MVSTILGRKIGMTQVFDEDDNVVPVTVIQAGPCVVSQVKSVETDGYNAVQIGFGDIKKKRVNKPMAGHFARSASRTPPRTTLAMSSPLPTSPRSRVSTSPAPPRARASRAPSSAGTSPAAPSPTAPATSVVRVPSVSAPIRPACARAFTWPATWATSALPSRTSSWSASTLSRTSCSSRVPSLVPRTPSCRSAWPKGLEQRTFRLPRRT